MMQQTALKYDVQVLENGHVELPVPFPAGAHLIVFILQADDSFDDLLMASASSLDFWNNPWDDEEWDSGLQFRDYHCGFEERYAQPPIQDTRGQNLHAVPINHRQDFRTSELGSA